MGFGWKWWVKTYFLVLFSREIWLSWFFVLLEFLIFLGIFESETPIIQAIKGIAALLIIAVFFTTMGMIGAYFKVRQRQRVEKETAERMVFVNECRQSSMQATQPVQPVVEEPKPVVEEPKQNPWFLGAWADHLNDKRN